MELKCKTPEGEAGEASKPVAPLAAAKGSEKKLQATGDDAWAYRVEVAMIEERVRCKPWMHDQVLRSFDYFE